MERINTDKITLAHGNGGRLMHEAIKKFRLTFSNRVLKDISDAAEFSIKGARLAFSTDSYVIKPLFFPGGDIGKLAVYGTVNDISMKGAKPLFISVAFIIEEGLEWSIVEKIVRSIKKAADISDVMIATGDMKVVERGAVDKIFINTAGIGVINHPAVNISSKAKSGDIIIINGAIAEHGMAIFTAREKLNFKSSIKSDCSNLNFITERCVSKSKNISVMRDLTRGGLAQAMNEIADSSNLGIEISQKDIPIKPNVKKICDVLGFDPLYIANEGKFVSFVEKKDADRVKKAMGPGARIIGRVTAKHKKEVYLTTEIGSSRILAMLEKDQLPRIC